MFKPLTETGIRASDTESSTKETTDRVNSDEENSLDGFASEPDGMSPRNNRIQSLKSKRSSFEDCLNFGRESKNARPPENAHRLDKNPRIKQFRGSFYSTLNTKHCFHCTICLKLISFEGTHRKHHKLGRSLNRTDTTIFSMEMHLCIRNKLLFC